jgi:hypothetical protein
MENSTTRKHKLDLTSGPITRSIFYLAGPVVATMFLETAFSIADIFWVGKLGAVSLAAVISSAIRGSGRLGVEVHRSRADGPSRLQRQAGISVLRFLCHLLDRSRSAFYQMGFYFDGDGAGGYPFRYPVSKDHF